MSELAQFDYRSLLRKYMDNIIAFEGTSFISQMQDGLSPFEVAILEEIRKEISEKCEEYEYPSATLTTRRA